ncbi:MAG: hypothetical protein NTX64_13070 [Elusimicrobia bacterium]|nr:hypothetical protein [Elusimicrobiota bacterium]
MSLLLALAMGLTTQAAENVNVTVSKIKGLDLRVYGFVEAEYLQDTTQPAFLEEEDHYAVPTRTTVTPKSGVATGKQNFAGQHNRSLMSVRNSRLGFDLTIPKTESGLDSEGIIELDFLGNQASGANERDTLNNPAVRVRHAYANLTYDDWNAKIGQTWSLLGWQPYYFPGEAIDQPGPGQLYRRFVQARVMNTRKLGDAWTFESAADMAKPAQMNSGLPEWHGGLRLASTKWKAASVAGGGASMVGLSAAVSGALIPIRTNGFGNPTGSVVAFDAAVPIIPSSDGKDRSNTLVWMGELASGNGIGGLEYAGLTSGVSQVSAGTAGSAAIDSGIAGTNLDGNAELIRYRAWRTHLQYSLPGGKCAASVGYAQVEARNLDRFSDPLSADNGFYPKIQFVYASLMYDPLAWLRFGAEWNQTRDTYNDPNNRTAANNRVQISTFLMF